MIHTILYLGRYDLNVHRLASHTGHLTAYRRSVEGGGEAETSSLPDKVNGIVFGYLEKAGTGDDRFYAVAVEDLVLHNEVLLIPDRHTDGKSFGPQASQFGDDSARALLSDLLAHNADQAARLREIGWKFFVHMPAR